MEQKCIEKMQRICTVGPAHDVHKVAVSWKVVAVDQNQFDGYLKEWTRLCLEFRLWDVLHELWECFAKDGGPWTQVNFLITVWNAVSGLCVRDRCRPLLQQWVADVAKGAHKNVASWLGIELVEEHGMRKIQEWTRNLSECLRSPRCVLAILVRACSLRNEGLVQWMCTQPLPVLQTGADMEAFWQCVWNLVAVRGPLVRGDNVMWDKDYDYCLYHRFPVVDLRCLLKEDADPVGRRCWHLLTTALKPFWTGEPCVHFSQAYEYALKSDNCTMVEVIYLFAQAHGREDLVKWPSRRRQKRGLIRKYSRNSITLLALLSSTSQIRDVWIGACIRTVCAFS